MTAGKATALTTAFLGVFALGVAVGPSVKTQFSRHSTSPQSVESPTPVSEPLPAKAETPRASVKPRARMATVSPKAEVPNPVRSAPATAAASIPASEPQLQARLKPVLNRGARMDVASEGFRSAEQFATVAHAARNTNIPFMLLKHRVLDEGRSLEDAIRESKPEVNARAEVDRAKDAAKSDLEALGG
jgi:hypothetical protein